jgi:hypothetical protein
MPQVEKRLFKKYNSNVGKKSIILIVLSFAVTFAGFFLVGRSAGLFRQAQDSKATDWSKLSKTTGLEISADPKDPATINVFAQTRQNLEPSVMAFETLKIIDKLGASATELEGLVNVCVTIKSSSDKCQLIIPVNDIKLKAKGELGDKDLWNHILSGGTDIFKSTGSAQNKERFIQLFQALQPDSQITVTGSDISIISERKDDWDKICTALMMSLQSCIDVSGFWADNVSIQLNDSGKKLLVQFKASVLKDVTSGKITPSELTTKIHLEWLR